jgi:hypothetical protein
MVVTKEIQRGKPVDPFLIDYIWHSIIRHGSDTLAALLFDHADSVLAHCGRGSESNSDLGNEIRRTFLEAGHWNRGAA